MAVCRGGAVARKGVNSQKPRAKKSPHFGLIKLVSLAEEACKWWLWLECDWADNACFKYTNDRIGQKPNEES